MKWLSQIIAYAAIAFGIWLVYGTFALPNKSLLEVGKQYKDLGTYGDYVGGIIGTVFSVAGVFFIVASFIQQGRSFIRERMEAQFFEMVKIHRENVNELSFTKKNASKSSFLSILKVFQPTDEPEKHTGRKVFKVIYSDFQKLYEETKWMFENLGEADIYTKAYLDNLKENKVIKARGIDNKEYAQLDIVYSMLFIGLSSEDRAALANIFSGRYNQSFTTSVLAYASLKPAQHSGFYETWLERSRSVNFNSDFGQLQTKSLYRGVGLNSKVKHNQFFLEFFEAELGHKNLDPIKLKFDKFYGGHQFRLGHYFRHIFNTINFVDDRKELDYSSKRNYIRAFRAQLSTFEQIIFFLNSISIFGRIWELENINPKPTVAFNKRLVTKYDLIKNIPNDKVAGEIQVSKYYPQVSFETKYSIEDAKRRASFEKNYRFWIIRCWNNFRNKPQ